jgi:triacylglycerol esterase/lipase EstA (alpha/beta hydrolase family)
MLKELRSVQVAHPRAYQQKEFREMAQWDHSLTREGIAMTFRPTRRQVLTAAFATVTSGAVVPVILTRKPTQAAGAINLNLQLPGVRQNTYPNVLVHGFAGFGRNGFHGLVKYWGGLHGDVQQDLVNLGFQTVTAAIGPFSSNWDRACELYAQIKGGTVDYGAAHAQKFGHARFGRTFPGLLPQWGMPNANGGINKVHLIGHSMGAQTTRRLAQLLGQGSAEEMAATPAN